MNKVIIINLNGNAYQLEENGYDALRAYLDTAARRLDGNPDKDEIIADIEQSIADKFRAMLGAAKTVVVTKEVEGVIADMGTVEDATGGAAPGAAGAGPTPPPSPAEPAGTHKRLYKMHDGAMIAGVCNGIAAYLGIDVTIVRIVFVLLSLGYGSGILIYILMAIIIPTADTPAEKAAATGSPSTSQEFIRRARAGYYEGMKTFRDKRAYREWKRNFKRDMRQNAQQWKMNWHMHWKQQPHPGSWVAYPVLRMMCVLVTLLGIWCVFSLITSGSVLGFYLPAGIPTWLGVILLILFFQLLCWPIKAMKYSLYYGAHPGPWHPNPFFHVLHTIFCIVLIVAVVGFLGHHSFRFREAVDSLPHEAHRAVDSIRDWWDRQ